eukprot:2154504-Pleurochrysis_carterae.AAC.1
MLTPTPVLLPRTGLQSRAIVGSTPSEATGSVPMVDHGQCDRPPSTPQRRTLPLRNSRSCIHAGSAQRCFQAPVAPPPVAFSTPTPRLLPARAARPAIRGALASKGQVQHN